MPRIRSIKPEFWADYPTARLSRDARLLYIGLWNFADEHGRLAGDPRLIKGQVFPYDDDLSAELVDVLLDELCETGKVVRYADDSGAPYLHVTRLGRHQRLEPAKVPSRFPEPPGPGGGGRPSTQIRTDESARGTDGAERISAPQAVDDRETAPEPANAQVNDLPQVGADEPARRSGESSLLYVAGSREHAAGSSNAHATTADDTAQPLPPQLAILRSKLNARRLVVRWDKLTTEQLTQIGDLIEVHGDAPLVKAALNSFRPDSPPVFAQAWISTWAAIPAPGEHLHAAPEPACTLPGHNGTERHCNECASELKAAR